MAAAALREQGCISAQLRRQLWHDLEQVARQSRRRIYSERLDKATIRLGHC
jgi:hypothetical protein